MKNKKIFDSFLDYKCPWCDRKLKKCKDIFKCETCGDWDKPFIDNRIQNISRNVQLRKINPNSWSELSNNLYYKNLLKIKEYYDEQTT